MFSLRQRLRLGIALASLFLLACGSGSASAPDPEYQKLAQAGTVEPASELERELLVTLPEMEPGTRVELDGGAAVAGRAYAAASGRRCREVTLEPAGGTQPNSRLVCLVDGTWSFVPDVIAPEPAPGQEGAATASKPASAEQKAPPATTEHPVSGGGSQ